MANENVEIGLESRRGVRMFPFPLIHLAAEMLAAVKQKGGAKGLGD